MTVFSFQNMMNMQKGYAYQNFNSIVLKKTYKNIVYLPRTKLILTNPKKVTFGGIGPNLSTNSLPQPHLTQIQFSPTN